MFHIFPKLKLKTHLIKAENQNGEIRLQNLCIISFEANIIRI